MERGNGYQWSKLLMLLLCLFVALLHQVESAQFNATTQLQATGQRGVQVYGLRTARRSARALSDLVMHHPG